jgi:predicted metalloprotease with PDZ domain
MRRRVTFDEVRHAVESVKGQTWAEFAQRHADSGRGLVYKAAREYAGLTLREIGAAAGGADYAAVGMAIRRLDQRREWDKALSRQWRRVVAALQPRA